MIEKGFLDNELFWESLKEHQALIDYLNENVGNDGLIRISRKLMAKHLNKSPTLMAHYIKRLNRVDNCIEQIKPGVYKLNYTDLRENGVFPVMHKALNIMDRNIREYIFMNYKQKAEYLGVPVSLIPVLEGYMYAELSKIKLK